MIIGVDTDCIGVAEKRREGIGRKERGETVIGNHE